MHSDCLRVGREILGEDIQKVCEVFNATYKSELRGDLMELKRMPDGSATVCSTAKGLQALQKMGAFTVTKTPQQQDAMMLIGLLAGFDGPVGGILEMKTTGAPIIYPGKDDRINKVLISPMAAQVFFGSSFMSNQEFATFMHSKFGLPDLEGELVEVRNAFTRQTDFETKYFGYSHEGYSVNIDETKMFVLESTK